MAEPERYEPVDEQLVKDYPELEELIRAKSQELAALWGVDDV